MVIRFNGIQGGLDLDLLWAWRNSKLMTCLTSLSGSTWSSSTYVLVQKLLTNLAWLWVPYLTSFLSQISSVPIIQWELYLKSISRSLIQFKFTEQCCFFKKSSKCRKVHHFILQHFLTNKNAFIYTPGKQEVIFNNII